MDFQIKASRRTNLNPKKWPWSVEPHKDFERFKSFRSGGSRYETKPEELQVWMNKEALEELEEQASDTPEHEVFGVLAGEYCVFGENELLFVMVDKIIKSKTAKSEAARVWVSEDDWNALYDERISRFPHLRQVGWYHSHPNWGVFLSGADLDIHSTYFRRDSYITFVCDPQKKLFFANPVRGSASVADNERLDSGFFVWHEGKIVGPRGFTIYDPKEALYEFLGNPAFTYEEPSKEIETELQIEPVSPTAVTSEGKQEIEDIHGRETEVPPSANEEKEARHEINGAERETSAKSEVTTAESDDPNPQKSPPLIIRLLRRLLHTFH